ncbi:MAG: arsenite methyltransferase [Chloroflexi bacterium]|nr:arsenite methyltransferase [Chloroflexota bacterium]
MTDARDSQEVKEFVRARYASLARAKAPCCGAAPSTPSAGCEANGLYSEKELEGVPQEAAAISLGCGNPTAIAEIKEGEVVLDLGSGGGLDCLLAAQRVGSSGQVIGLDMTPEMIELARSNAAKVGAENVEFRQGEMEDMPLDDASVDVIISNCVINLSPDKDIVFREAFRVLKPGGRLSVSDIVLLRELPPKVARSLEQWAGCVAGALSEAEYRAKLEAAGFVDVAMRGVGLSLPGSEPLNGFAVSMDIKAYKPGG